MFASFELRPEGLTRAEPRPKLIRDADGCLPCRRKRKRCDKTKPACLRCRNSTNRDLCTWPQIIKKQRTDLEHDDCNASEASYAPIPTAGSREESESVEQRKALALSSPKLNSKELSALSFMKLPDSVAKVSPELSLANLVEISVGFQRKLLCGKDEYEPSMLLMGFEPTNMCPSLIHAWAACSIAAVAPPSPEWQQRALLHHSNALIEMRKSIEEGPASETAEEAACKEGRRATVLMLHIFESQVQSYTRHGNTKLATSHLNAAHRIFAESLMKGGPSSMHDLLLLEGYILRTALNILFVAEIQLPLNFIELVVGHYKMGLKRCNITLNLKQCPWLGPLGYELIDRIYQLSWLAHKIPLRGERMIELMAISRSIAVLKLPSHYETDQNHEYLRRSILLWQSHIIACQLLASWIAGPDQQMDNLQQDQQFTGGMKLLDEASQDSKLCMPVLWPLIIFSMMLSTPAELTLCQNVAERARRSAGEGVVSRIIAWQNDVYSLRLLGKNVRVKDLLALVTSNVVFL